MTDKSTIFLLILIISWAFFGVLAWYFFGPIPTLGRVSETVDIRRPDAYSRQVELDYGKKSVWEILACDPVTGKIADVPLGIVDDKLLEITSIVPEEYKEWIWKTAGDLNMQHHRLVIQARNAANSVWLRSEKPVGIERKDIVLKLQAEIPELWQEVLSMVDGRPERAVESIWKRLEPKHEVPLVQEGEDE